MMFVLPGSRVRNIEVEHAEYVVDPGSTVRSKSKIEVVLALSIRTHPERDRLIYEGETASIRQREILNYAG